MRLVFDHEHEHPLCWSAIMSISSKIGTSQTLNEWVKKADVDSGKRAGNWRPIWRPWNGRPGELRQANEILRPNGRLII